MLFFVVFFSSAFGSLIFFNSELISDFHHPFWTMEHIAETIEKVSVTGAQVKKNNILISVSYT